MNILSLFDGMSCGQLALNRAGINYTNYFASEIDKDAIKVTQYNYPNTKQLGDIRYINTSDLPQIDILFGGSPCTSFSFSGKRNGMTTFDNIDVLSLQHYLELKNSDYIFEGQSYLFWEYVRVLNETQPKYFLLENVVMSKKWENIITDVLGVKPIYLNSNLLSAQSRPRIYWTNIPDISTPDDKKLVLNDILESCVPSNLYIDDKYQYLKAPGHTSRVGLVYVGGIDSSKRWLDGKNLSRNFSQGNRVYSSNGKSSTLCANGGGLGGKTGLYLINDIIRKLSRIECERLQTVPDNYTSIVTDSHAKKMLGNGWTVDVISHIFKHIK